MIGIHNSPSGFSNDWIKYCEDHHIPYKIINCYQSDIVEQLEDCNALLWHHHHTDAKDFLFAKELLFGLEQSGKQVFPEFNSGWHFDDKLGQKYLLEAIGAPVCPTYVFYEKSEALHWITKTTFPKVFKLRGGAGSNNVKLVRSEAQARSLIGQAFGKGFPNYDKWGDWKENWRRFRMGKATHIDLLKSIRRGIVSTRFARTRGPEKGYALFQAFIAKNDSDIRVVVIGNRAFAIKRIVREGDFRASGSGLIRYEKEEIPMETIRIAFEVSERLKASCVAYDFVYDHVTAQFLIVEINYGFALEVYFPCPGYWDRQLNWHEGAFNSAHWMVEEILAQQAIE